MTTPPTFPTLAGEGWDKHKRPIWDTLVAKHPSGSDVRVALWQFPLWDFELTFNVLDSGARNRGAGLKTLQTLFGFFLDMGGDWSTFLYADPDDDSVTGQAIGVGDGASQQFTFSRTLGGATEPVGWVLTVSAVYLNGTPTAAYTLIAPNQIFFASPPALGVSITADFTFAFVCRFMNDDVPFEQFMSQLWTVKTLKFRSVRTI